MNKKLEDFKERCLIKIYQHTFPKGDYKDLKEKFGESDPTWPMAFSLDQTSQMAVIEHVCQTLAPEEKKQVREAVMLGDAPCIAPPYYRDIPIEVKVREFIELYMMN